MRFGINTLLWTADVTADELYLIDRVAEWGFDGIEIGVQHNLAISDYRAIRARLNRFNLGVTVSAGVNAECNPLHHDSEIRRRASARLQRIVEICETLEADIACGPFAMPVNVFGQAEHSRSEWEHAVDILSQAASYAEHAGVRFAFEYLNRFQTNFATCTAEAIRLIDAIGSPSFGLVCNTYHAHIEELSAGAAIEAAGDRIFHVQIAESDRATPGRGQVDWDETFAGLRAIGYDGWYVIQSFLPMPPDVAAVTRTWRAPGVTANEIATDGLAFLQRHCEETQL